MVTYQSRPTERHSAEISCDPRGDSQVATGNSGDRPNRGALMFPGGDLLMGTFCFSGHHHGVPPLPTALVWNTNLGHWPGPGWGNRESRAEKRHEAGSSSSPHWRGRRLTHFEGSPETGIMCWHCSEHTVRGKEPCGSSQPRPARAPCSGAFIRKTRVFNNTKWGAPS